MISRQETSKNLQLFPLPGLQLNNLRFLSWVGIFNANSTSPSETEIRASSLTVSQCLPSLSLFNAIYPGFVRILRFLR